jgi:hypothetical protein
VTRAGAAALSLASFPGHRKETAMTTTTTTAAAITATAAARYAAGYFATVTGVAGCSVEAVTASPEGEGALDVSVAVHYRAYSFDGVRHPAHRAVEVMTCWLESGRAYGEW